MSEYPHPWHDLDPADWPAKEEENRRALHAARERGDRRHVRRLLYQIHPPLVPEWLTSPADTGEEEPEAD